MSVNNLAVQLEGVGHQFAELCALNQINLSLPSGMTMALLGHNGAGKSTLIKVILGLLTPDSGRVDVLGQRLTPGKKPSNVGYLPENIHFYDKLTGAEILRYFAALKGESHQRVAQLIEEFGLGYAQHKLVKGYSKGMKQRLGFAQAILASPQLLLLDEPTVGLDPQASSFLYQKVAQLKRQGCAVIICTHELNLVESQLDVAMMLGRGQCLAYGSFAELAKASPLQVKIVLDGLAALLVTHPYLQAFYRQGALHCAQSEQPALVRYLTTKCQRFDFTLHLPGLAEIYHHNMAQMQHCSEQGLGFVTEPVLQPMGV